MISFVTPRSGPTPLAEVRDTPVELSEPGTVVLGAGTDIPEEFAAAPEDLVAVPAVPEVAAPCGRGLATFPEVVPVPEAVPLVEALFIADSSARDISFTTPVEFWFPDSARGWVCAFTVSPASCALRSAAPCPQARTKRAPAAHTAMRRRRMDPT
ncbi:MAG: hypothetical protein IJL56_05215 [Bacteroidales bacterium]|nr:hypothetical protein [Bacteroidales bacterium]